MLMTTPFCQLLKRNRHQNSIKKIRKLGYAISKIGFKTSSKLPAIVGLAEVEVSEMFPINLFGKILFTSNFWI